MVKLLLNHPNLRQYREYQQRPAMDTDGLTVWFLGTSSMLLSDGRTWLLSDGFVTRPGLPRVIAGRIAPDRSTIQAAISRLRIGSLAAVFCAHSHYDHALDAPVWALETGADLIGSASTANLGRGLAVPENALRVVTDGQTLRYGRFELTFVHSVHSPGDRYPGVIEQPLTPPARAGAWRSDTSYSVLVTHPRGRILLHASANWRPGALHGHQADVVYLGIGELGKRSEQFVATYWEEVVRATGARRVVLIHWDDFFTSLDRPLRPMPYALDDLRRTMNRLVPLARADGVEILLPVAWQPTQPLAD
jgi:L-ascorbate metabolism protein UlaG (beta-lactamase superfamily)